MLDSVWFESISSLFGAVGVFSYFRILWKKDSRTFLEKRLLWLLGCLGVLLVIREPYWITGNRILGSFTFLIASLIPLSVLIYAESLLRRHFPKIIKLFAMVGTLVFVLFSLCGLLPYNHIVTLVFIYYLIVLSVWVAARLIFRDRNDISSVENAMVDSTFVAVGLGLPFFITDILADIGLSVVRMGTVSALIWVYTCIRTLNKEDTKRVVFQEVMLAGGIALLICGLQFALLQEKNLVLFLRNFSFILCCNYLYMVKSRLSELHVDARSNVFLHSIVNSDTRSIDSFLKSIDHIPLVSGYYLATPTELKDYDHEQVVQVFEQEKTDILSRSLLRKKLKDLEFCSKLSPQMRSGVEQVKDILDRKRMTHICCIQESPLFLLLVNIPQAGYEQTAVLEVGLVRKVASLITPG